MNPITVRIYNNSVSKVVTHFIYTTTSATAEAIFNVMDHKLVSFIHTFPNVRHPAGTHYIGDPLEWKPAKEVHEKAKGATRQYNRMKKLN